VLLEVLAKLQLNVSFFFSVLVSGEVVIVIVIVGSLWL